MVVAGTIQTRQDSLDYMTWTFFFRRLLQNLSYYGMKEVEDQGLNTFLFGVVGKALDSFSCGGKDCQLLLPGPPFSTSGTA